MSFLLDFSNAFFEDNNYDDSADKVNRQYMTAFLIFLIAFLGLKQFVGDPIQCFTPQYFSGGQELYVDGYCWTASTYQILDTEYDPIRGYDSVQAILHAGDGHDEIEEETHKQDAVDGKKKLVSYYQWIPLLVVVQAILFFIPYVFWKSCSGDAGVDVEQITKAAGLLGECEGELHHRHDTLKNITELFNRYITVTKPLRRPGDRADSVDPLCCFLPEGVARSLGMTSSTHYAFMYIIYKLLTITNLALQLFFLHVFLDTNVLLHGFRVFYNIVLQQKWISSERFPINTLCEFRGQPQVHGYLISYTAHCVLPINLYNDKLYAVMTLIFTLALVYSLFALVNWLFLLTSADKRNEIIEKHLLLNKEDEAMEARLPDESFEVLLNEFIKVELKVDGVFILNMIDNNCGSSVTDQLVRALWNSFLDRKFPQPKGCHLEHLRMSTHFDGDDFRMYIKPTCDVHGTHVVRHDQHDVHSSGSENDYKGFPSKLNGLSDANNNGKKPPTIV